MYKRANDPRQSVCPTSEHPPPTQSESNIRSVGASECRTQTERCAMPPRFQEATHANVSVVVIHVPTVGIHHSVTGTPHSPLSQTSLANCWVFVFRSMLTNRHQRLQPFNLSFCCPHSLCNAVGGQHSPRKPLRGAGRVLTANTKQIFMVNTP